VSEERPPTDDRDPGDVVKATVEHVLSLARTWVDWDGVPRSAGDRVHTPHKAVRRVADHLIDHLAQIDARLAGQTELPDHWHGSYMTTPADMAPFTVEDFEEAESRLSRLGHMWAMRMRGLGPEELDAAAGDEWSIREIAFHLTESVFYADAIGRLEPPVESSA
jgi:hypothetical protein